MLLHGQELDLDVQTVWPSGLRRCVKAAVRKGVGSNPTAVIVGPRYTLNII